MPETMTSEQKSMVKDFRNSIRLDSPGTASDPAYTYTDEELLRILQRVAPVHNRKHNLDTLPSEEFHFVVMLGKKEVFYQLAFATADFYPLEAEGASLNKNVRFDHYSKLVQTIKEDYRETVQLWKDSAFGEASSYDITAQKRHFSIYNYNRSNKPEVTLSLSNPTSSTIDCDWTKFSVPGGIFGYYKIYVSKEPIMDEYEENPLLNKNSVYLTHDIHQLKYRLKKLDPDTTYYVGVASYDRNGRYGYDEQTIDTLPLS